jgi:hypothetical protein
MIITTLDLREHLNLADGDESDTLLAGKIEAAEAWIEGFAGITLTDFATEGENGDEYPGDLKEAVRQLAAHFYENREATLVGVSANALPFGVTDLLAPYREWVF